MALIPKPKFPNIPKLPGVPQLLRSPLFPPGPPPVLSGVLAGFLLFDAFSAQSAWGVFNSKGERVVSADNISEFSYSNEYNVSDYPIQDGDFFSYNKVANPFETSLRFTKGGTKAERRTFLAEIEAVLSSLQLYSIITPERTYTNCNMLRHEVTRRGAKGAYFLTEVDVFFREIRSVTAQYSTSAPVISDPKNASATDVQNNGTVGGTNVTPEVTGRLAGVGGFE
jgi:hypothetical protein